MHIPDLTVDSSLVWGLGEAINSVRVAALEIAPTDIPILILGESGTGKEIFARLLHRLSLSSEAEFKKLSCSVLDPAELLHYFQDPPTNSQAHPLRTLFLDSIDELDPACQRILLTMLPDGQAKSVRVISSSCRDVQEAVQLGHFRKELFFRINGFCLRLPSLRERKEDIGAFVEFFRRKYSQELGRPAPELDQDALDILSAYDWPGNIRELENLVKKIVVFGNAQAAVEAIRTSKPIPASTRGFFAGASLKAAAKAACRSAERALILQALERTRWNRKRAARELQISYKSLLYKIKQIGVSAGKNES